MMMRMLLVRGMLSGLAAGLVALLFAYVVGEPTVNAAIGFESAEQAAKGEAPDPELVSRAVQSTIGLATGVLVYAVAFGGLFAIAYAVAYGRLGRISPRATAVVVALGGYLATFVVPSLKYPANPPSVGNADSIDSRTGTYFGLVIVSIVLAVAATYLGRRLVGRFGAWNATLLAGAAYLAAMVLATWLFPGINEVPENFPAAVLWKFRIASLGTQLVMWATIGLLFGALVQRRLAQRQPSTSPGLGTAAPAH